ncbi:MAG: potB, partial [Clostridia bacterium]|nr:potB [Clostridia bacterium]
MKRTIFAYPYIAFAIVFLLVPLFLIIFYSITLPINPISISPREEIIQNKFIENLNYIGYIEDKNLSKPGTFYSTGDTLTVYNNILNRNEWFNITFTSKEVLNIDEIDENGQVIDNITSLRLETVRNGFSFTLQHFIRFFQSTVYINVLFRSLYIALISTLICLLLGFPTAYILSRMGEAKRNLVSVLFILPMWMNFLLRTYAWRTLLEKNGVINEFLRFLGFPEQEMMYSKGAVILCMVYNF